MKSKGGSTPVDAGKVRRYFDEQAPSWSKRSCADPELVRSVLKRLAAGPGSRILDIGCGTGVLFPFYMECGARVTGVDLSAGMIAAARAEYGGSPAVSLVCADACRLPFQQEFDLCVIFDSLPHFPDIPGLLQTAAGCLREGGRLCILFDHSRAWVNSHHEGLDGIARGLPAPAELEAMLPADLMAETAAEDETHYLLIARRQTADPVLQ